MADSTVTYDMPKVTGVEYVKVGKAEDGRNIYALVCECGNFDRMKYCKYQTYEIFDQGNRHTSQKAMHLLCTVCEKHSISFAKFQYAAQEAMKENKEAYDNAMRKVLGNAEAPVVQSEGGEPTQPQV